MTEAAERWSACSIATAAWPRTWRQPADRGVSWRSQGRWRRARPHRPNSETGSERIDPARSLFTREAMPDRMGLGVEERAVARDQGGQRVDVGNHGLDRLCEPLAERQLVPRYRARAAHDALYGGLGLDRRANGRVRGDPQIRAGAIAVRQA